MNMSPTDLALLGMTGRLLKKPFEDFYENCSTKIKEFAKAWMTAGAVDRIEQTIEDLERLRTIVSRQTSTLSEIYYPARVIVKKQYISAESAKDISENKNVLITGTAGQGKSVLMRYLAVQELRSGRRVPIFIELRRIDVTTNLIDLIRIQLNLNSSVEGDEILVHLLSRGNVVLILDGFDEVPREFSLQVRDKIFELISSYKKIQVFISSRPGALCSHLQDLPNLLSVEVAELAESEFEPFLRKIGTDELVLKLLLTAINSSPTQVKELLKTPLMLTLLVLTCGGKQQIPDTLPEFYDSLFRVLAIMHDETKPGYVRQMATKLSYAELEQLFECFAFVSREKFDRTSLNPSQFEDSTKAAIDYTGKVCTPEGFRTDVSETVCLMVREGIDTTFIHKSIQEYYTARFIKSLPDDAAVVDAYNSITELRLITWTSELRFLEQIDPVRYKIFFRKPQIERFLIQCHFNKDGRKLITKKGLKNCISALATLNVGSRSVVVWTDEGIKNLNSLITLELARTFSSVLKPSDLSTSEGTQTSHTSLAKAIEFNPSLFLKIESIVSEKIREVLIELDEIAEAERKRKGALINILKKSPKPAGIIHRKSSQNFTLRLDRQ